MPSKPIPCVCGRLKSFTSEQCRACWISDPDKTTTSEPIEKRFWKHVTKTESCWLWNGSHLKSGYGIFHDLRMHCKKSFAHRISWEIHFGQIPAGISVLHHCDNPPCIRPSHLFTGTQADNLNDMDQKGRRVRKGPKGEANSHAKLTELIVKEIRQLSQNGMKQKELVLKFKTPQVTISHILHYRTWKHI